MTTPPNVKGEVRTPRVDAVEEFAETKWNMPAKLMVPADFARQLERENAQLVEDRKMLMEALDMLLPVAKETCERWPNDDIFLIPTAHARILLATLKSRP